MKAWDTRRVLSPASDEGGRAHAPARPNPTRLAVNVTVTAAPVPRMQTTANKVCNTKLQTIHRIKQLVQYIYICVY